MPTETIDCPARRVTEGPFLHYFGYYDKCPWDPAERRMLALRVAFMHRSQTPDDMAVIGYYDLQTGCWTPLAETMAWNWQQGTMLQWMPSGEEIIYNTRGPQGFGSTVLNVETGAARHLPRPIYAMAPDGRSAVTLNFARVCRTRPGYGYCGVQDPWEKDSAPAEDGVYWMDLQTGVSKRVVDIAAMAARDVEPSMVGAEHWFNHLQFNTTGTRFLFLHRWKDAGGSFRQTRLYTANPDGTDLRYLGKEGMISHFDWRDEDHILAWSRYNGENHYHIYTDKSDRVEVMGRDVFDQDGHCSYSPDRRWVLTDTYPSREDSKRTLILYQPETNRRVDIGRYYSSPEVTGEMRCDLHPRWSRQGTQVCFDSIHEGPRQMYVCDVSAVVRG